MNHNAGRCVGPVLLGAGVLVVLCVPAARVSAETRVLHFPKDRSMGTVCVLDWGSLETAGYSDWQVLCEATGDVAVPAGKAVRLDLSREVGKDLAPLAALEPNNVQMLFCRFVELWDDELRHVAHLTGLREIYLRDTGILGTGLKHLAGLKSLEDLDVGNTHVGDNELAHLVGLASLRSLHLSGTPTNDEGMVHVGKIASLESLGLSRGVGDEGLRHLRNLANLHWLSGGSQAISDEGLAHLAGLTRMESLDLRGTRISDAGLVHLKQMAELRHLCLYGTRVTERGFVHLEGFRKLESLDVLFGVGDSGLAALSKLPSLKNVTIDGDSITAEGLALLPAMKSLEHLYVDNTDRMDAIIGGLPELPRLKRLTLGTGLTDGGLLGLRNMASLSELVVGPARLTGKGIAALAPLPSLQMLSIDQMELASPDEWASFAKLSALRRLSLKHIRSRVSDAHVAHLADLQSLTDLSLSAIVIEGRKVISWSMDVTDEGLSHIAKLKKLESLSLHGAKITDQGLQQLAELPELKWLDLQGCGVTEGGLKRLKKRLPALQWYL